MSEVSNSMAFTSDLLLDSEHEATLSICISKRSSPDPNGCIISHNVSLSSESAKDIGNIIKPLIHFNNAGASPSPTLVLKTVMEHLVKEAIMGGYLAAEECFDDLERVYRSLSTLLHTNSPVEIALTESATVAWTRAFYSLADYQCIGENDVILTCENEYAGES